MSDPTVALKLALQDDPLNALRAEFVIPTHRQMKALAVEPDEVDQPCTYLCGNSLGLLPKSSKNLIEEELEVWATRAVEGHFDHPHNRNWVYIADTVHPLLADIVGANETEVACMSTLTANLHLMLNTFYKPTTERYKILCEARAFPSDQYAFASQVQSHGLNPGDAIVELSPRPGESILRESDIIAAIEREGSQLALVIFAGCQYYTGQVFPFARITAAAHAQGSICGWDLAHAVGNVSLALHDWNVDFAVWCSYKYLNSGPGGIGGLFLHEKWENLPIRGAGWWGHDPMTRFDMPPRFSAIRGAQGFQQSNPSVLATVSLLGSLQVFERAGGMVPLRARSVRLTGLLEALLRRSRFWITPELVYTWTGDNDRRVGMSVITPEDVEERGSQLSLVLLPLGQGLMPRVQERLQALGVVGDTRKPDVIRFAPCALYNTWEDVERAVKVLDEVLTVVNTQK